MSNYQQDLENLVDIINDQEIFKEKTFNGYQIVFSILKDKIRTKSLLNKFFFLEELINETYEINLIKSRLDNFKFYYNEENFVSIFDIQEENSNHLILKAQYSRSSDNRIQSSKLFTENFIQFYEIKKYLSNNHDFTPFVDESNNSFTIISKQNGIFTVGYTLPSFKFFYEKEMSGKLDLLKSNFSKKEFIHFFKENVITVIHSYGESLRFSALLENLEALISLTDRDYETYVESFAFDKVKTEFKEERQKYFEDIDKNIDSISKQVVSFPLTFAASVFASYKVKNDPKILLLILIAYLLYTIIAFLILRITKYNISCLNEDVLEEEKLIKTSYNKIYEDFKRDFEKIKVKISNLKLILRALFITLLFLFCLFCFYTCYRINLIEYFEKLGTKYLHFFCV